MANLLDNPNDVGMLSLGLRLVSTPGKFGSALGTAGLGAMGDMQQAKQAQALQQQRVLQQEMQRLQVEQIKRQQAEQEQQRQRQMAVEGAYRGALESPAQQALAAGGGPTVGNAQAMQGMAPRLNQQKLIEQLMAVDPNMAAKLAMPKEVEIKEFREIRMPDGSVQVVGFSKDGKPVNTGQTPFKPMERQNMGGFLGGIDPITGKMTNLGAMTQSPDSAASIAVQIRGQNMTDARAREAAAAAAAGRADAGPAKLSSTAEKAALDKEADNRRAQQTMAGIAQARKLLQSGPTASGAGAAADFLGRQVGVSSKSAQIAAQLETLSGWLMSNVPRMEGPQSNADVLVYQQMAARVGDRTVPVPERLAALGVLETLQRRYSEIRNGGQTAEPSAPQPSGAVRKFNPVTGRIE